MGIFEALILGVVQGLTEFLPVSSSGHIEIVKELLNVSTKQQNLLMTVVLHAASALSTLVIFRKDIVVIFSGGMMKPNFQLKLFYLCCQQVLLDCFSKTKLNLCLEVK